MKKTLTLFLTTIALSVAVSNSALAQMANKYSCGNKYSEEGDKFFKVGSYYQAYLSYEKMLKKASKDKDAKACMTFQIARCFHKMNDLKKAIQWYQKAEKANFKSDDLFAL